MNRQMDVASDVIWTLTVFDWLNSVRVKSRLLSILSAAWPKFKERGLHISSHVMGASR